MPSAPAGVRSRTSAWGSGSPASSPSENALSRRRSRSGSSSGMALTARPDSRKAPAVPRGPSPVTVPRTGTSPSTPSRSGRRPIPPPASMAPPRSRAARPLPNAARPHAAGTERSGSCTPSNTVPASSDRPSSALARKPSAPPATASPGPSSRAADSDPAAASASVPCFRGIRLSASSPPCCLELDALSVTVRLALTSPRHAQRYATFAQVIPTSPRNHPTLRAFR